MMNLLLIFFALILVILNAFFVAAEFSIVKLRSTQIASIKKHYGFKGKILALVHNNLDNYLSACQLGITLTSLSLGWIGEPAFASLLREFFSLFDTQLFTEELIHVLAFSIGFGIISFLHIVVGELVPKSLAIRQSVLLAIWTAVPLYIFYLAMYPAIWLLNCCSNFVLKITGVTNNKAGSFFSTEEIKLILRASHLHGELTKEETEILKRTLVFADLKVSKVIRPFDELVTLDSSYALDKVSKIIKKHRYSRYPVYNSIKKQFVGLVHVKDLFIPYARLRSKKIASVMRPLVKVSDSLAAIELLQKFREGKSHFALVYDKDHNVTGFATLDNLLHILIGYVKDEFHKTKA